MKTGIDRRMIERSQILFGDWKWRNPTGGNDEREF